MVARSTAFSYLTNKTYRENLIGMALLGYAPSFGLCSVKILREPLCAVAYIAENNDEFERKTNNYGKVLLSNRRFNSVHLARFNLIRWLNYT